jgi:hypothetical protein
MKLTLKEIYFNYLWWIWQIILVILCGFFLVFGIQILIKSYQLNNPAYFMMIFFASNLIILISVVLMAGFLYRMYGVYRLINNKDIKPNIEE